MVGLTGGIGAGKSVASARLAELGAVVIDADALAREVVAAGTEGLTEVVAAFGREVLASDGSLDRPALGRRVFGDEQARRQLERIIHPRVRARATELANAAAPDAIVVQDIPLLVESGQAAAYHLVVVVQASEAVRLARLTTVRGMTKAEAMARMRAQVTDEQRALAADAVLPNDGTVAQLHRYVDALWTDRLVPYEVNLRHRTPVRPSGPYLRPPDPSWPQRYARVAARVARAAGTAAQRIDHIGATAVPDVPAEDTVVVQLVVADTADIDALADALADAGLPRVPDEWVEETWAGPPDGQPMRVHGSADPGQSVLVHVYPESAPGWRYALLIRDYLRANGPARAQYAQLTHELAAGAASRVEYLRAMRPWFAELEPRMQEWARHTGWRP